MNEQERSRLVERIVENHLDESERASLVEQAQADPQLQRELIAERAIARAVARDRQQLPLPSTVPSAQLMDALAKVPAASLASKLPWLKGLAAAGTSLIVAAGGAFLLFPSLFGFSEQAVPAKLTSPPAAVADSSSILPQVAPDSFPAHPQSEVERKENRGGATSGGSSVRKAPANSASEPASKQTEENATKHPEKSPQLPVLYENNGTIVMDPK